MRWRFLAIACAAALVLSLAISLLLAPQYTATVSLVIDPPASSDPRAATAISPIYLESLRTYESYADGDSLFAQAVDRFHLRTAPNQAVESLKRRILRVNKLKDSKILQIRVTLPDAAKAAQVAQFIADEVLKLSHKTGAGIDLEMLQNAERQLNSWQDRYRTAVDQSTEFNAKWPVEPLQAEIESLQDVASRVMRAALDAEADAEDYSAREKILAADPRDSEELRMVRQEAGARRARAGVLQRQARDLQATLSAKGVELSKRVAQHARLETDMKMAQSGVEAEVRHTREIRDAAGGRGEVLTIIDPGMVPQRPSSPNVILNVIVCVFIALVISIFSLVFSFGRSHAPVNAGATELRPRKKYGEI
jgi:capsular polysaccharide biosynthesis protein